MKIFGEHDDKTLEQLQDVASRAQRTALMADGHLGYIMPIGGVAAYHDRVSVVGVGFDIACGNKAVRLDIPAEEVRTNIKSIMDDIWANLSFGIGKSNQIAFCHLRRSTLNNLLLTTISELINQLRLTNTVATANHNGLSVAQNVVNNEVESFEVDSHSFLLWGTLCSLPSPL